MKYHLFFFIVFSLFSCEKEVDPVDYTCFTIVERQCASDPYASYLVGAVTSEDKAKAIRQYLKDQGIAGTSLVSNPFNSGAVCAACSCPNGVSYLLSLSKTDTVKLKSLNLLLLNKSCE